jgi:hypothetical protein
LVLLGILPTEHHQFIALVQFQNETLRRQLQAAPDKRVPENPDG